MSIEVTYLISFLFGFGGFVSVLYNLNRNRKSDLKQDAHTGANVAFELKALQTSLIEFKTEIKAAMDSNNKMTWEHHDKIIKLEERVNTAFVRIDELKGGIYK